MHSMEREEATKLSLADAIEVFAVVVFYLNLPSKGARLGARLAYLLSRCSILGRNTKRVNPPYLGRLGLSVLMAQVSHTNGSLQSYHCPPDFYRSKAAPARHPASSVAHHTGLEK